MFFIALLLLIGIVVLAFLNLTWSWIALGAATLILILILGAFKLRRWPPIPDLSPLANSMLKRYGHFYAWPITCRNYSGMASALMFGGGVVVVVGLFERFWWGLGLAAVLWLVLHPVSKAFNPGSFIRGTADEAAHQEVIEHMLAQQESDSMRPGDYI